MANPDDGRYRRPDPADVTTALLSIAYPAFRFSILTYGMTTRWAAVRRRGADPGLHTIISDDLEEIQNELGPAQPPPGEPPVL